MRKQHDPIDQLRDLLVKQNVKDDDLKAIDSKVKAVVTKATEFAQSSPEPDASELFTDILCQRQMTLSAMVRCDYGYRNQNAGFVADHGIGDACQMARCRG